MRPEDLLEHMRVLVEARLVSQVSPEQFEFRHALTREAVYATLLKTQRKRFHQEVAETLERLYGPAQADAHLADLAYHYSEAEAWDRVLDYSQRAGERAFGLYAPREAAEHFTRALEAAGRLGQPPPGAALRERGRAFEVLGEFDGARSDYELALEAARAAGDAAGEWQLLLDLGFLWAGSDYEQAGRCFQRALELAHASGDRARLAQSLNRVGNWYVNIGRLADGLQAHHEALAIFHAQRDEAGMAATLDLLGLAYLFIGQAEGAAYLQRAATLFRKLSDWRGLISSLASYLNHLSVPYGQSSQTLDECRRVGEEALALARQIGWVAGQSLMEWAYAVTLAGFGVFGEALAHAWAGLNAATEIEHRQWTAASHTTLGYIYTLLLQPQAAARHLEAALSLARQLGSIFWISAGGAYLALARLLAGDTAGAQAVLDAVPATLRADGPWETYTPNTLTRRHVAWAWGWLSLAQGRPAVALAIAERLLDSAGAPSGGPAPALWQLKGEALAALDRPDEARAALGSATQVAVQRGLRPVLWQLYRTRGRLEQRQGRPAEAEAAFAQARQVIKALAESIDDAALSQSFRETAMTTLRATEVGGQTSDVRL